MPVDVVETLEEEVKTYEPRNALEGGKDGLVFYRRIIAESGKFLSQHGMLFFEIGCEQREDVMRLMADAGFRNIICKKDYAGLDRVVFGQYIH